MYINNYIRNVYKIYTHYIIISVTTKGRGFTFLFGGNKTVHFSVQSAYDWIRLKYVHTYVVSGWFVSSTYLWIVYYIGYIPSLIFL